MSHRIALTALVLSATALLSVPAAAQQKGPTPSPPPGSRGGLYSAVTLTSDYRYQGISSTNRNPAVQGVIHHFRPDGWYAGLFVSEVDYGYAQSPNYELDLYAGKTLKLAPRTDLKFQVLATTFPDNKTPGPTFDFVQGGVSLIHRKGPLTFTGLTTFVPEGSYGAGQIWRVEGEAVYALNKTFSLKALTGHQVGERRPDRSYWSLGGAAKWRFLTLEVRYQDTSLSRTRCGFNPDICGPSVTGAVTAEFPLILF